LRLDGVGKRYGVRLPWVVRDVTLEIRPGALVRLEGRNGSGKSTLLRVIAGASAPSRGTVTGRPATGYVPERFPPALPFSARDYLGHIGRVHGMTSADVADRVRVCLDRLGGWDFADVPLRTMSKGMCQKVAVAQALLPPDGLLVLDEAWTGLDAEARATLDEVVAERLADGGSVVFVDHDSQRLSGLDAECWRIDHAQVRRMDAGQVGEPDGAVDGETGESADDSAPAAARAAPSPAATSAPPSASAASAPSPAVVIEVAGYPLDAYPPDDQPGVLDARRHGGRLVVRAEPGASDQVLRTLLDAADDVHVLGLSQTEADQ
jgi:ABC-2 type transport system ATP-binding protein